MRLVRVSRRQKRSRLDADAGHCEWSSWARMRTVALLSESIAAQIEPAGRSAAPGNTERYVDTDLLHRRQPAADAACCRAPAGESTAVQTKPARAGGRCRASAELHLTANAGRCECYSRARMRTAGSALAAGVQAMRHFAQVEPEGRNAVPSHF